MTGSLEHHFHACVTAAQRAQKLTWNGAAERSSVALQVPYLISGGFVIVLLTVVGAALFLVGAIRRLADDDEAEPAPGPPRSIGGPRR